MILKLDTNTKQKLQCGTGPNAYLMNYKNQLVLTGQINDVGAYTRTNVTNSYRHGIEAEFGIQPFKWLTWTGNITLSKNKIKNFKEYTDNYDTWGQDSILYSETDIAFHPILLDQAPSQLNQLKI